MRSILAALLISCFVPSDGSANPSAQWILTSSGRGSICSLRPLPPGLGSSVAKAARTESSYLWTNSMRGLIVRDL
jgi:hypothetical protein